MDIAGQPKNSLDDLRQKARGCQPGRFQRMKRQDLMLALLRDHAEKQGLKLRGVLEVGLPHRPLRAEKVPARLDDIYASQTQTGRFGLRTRHGDRPGARAYDPGEIPLACCASSLVNGLNPEQASSRQLEDLTPIFPLNASTSKPTPASFPPVSSISSPPSRGQRGLIVSPAKAGKTTVLKEIANSISQNYLDVHLMVVLIGERPEEVTDMDRSVDAEVIASTFDDPVTQHVRG
ncbi:MAG: hypothetical protein U0452_12025 [Anaerolineae bacterium]